MIRGDYMTLRQLVSNEYNGKKSIKTVTVTNMAKNEKIIVPVYQGHVYSAMKRYLSYDDFHGEVISYGRTSPRAANIDIVIKGKELKPAYEYTTEYDAFMMKYAGVYA